MAVTVYIPAPFRRLTDNRSYVEGHGDTVADLLEDLKTRYPALGHMLQNEAGDLPAHINVYVNNQEIRSLQGKATPLKDGDEVAVLPAIAGGQGLTPEQMQQIASARIYLAPEAKEIGLVDEIGYLKDAIAKTKSMAGLGADAKVVTFRRYESKDDNIYNPAMQSGGGGPNTVIPNLTQWAGMPEAGFYYMWPSAIGGP